MAVFPGGAGADSLVGGAEADAILGFAGSDTLTGNAGADTILGGAGDDAITGENASAPPLSPASDNLIRGGPGDDRVAAGLGADTVGGGAGADTIFGGIGSSTGTSFGGGASANFDLDGADLLRGGRGDDLLDGAAGADTLLGGAGNDTLRGGPGAGPPGLPGADLLAGGPGEDVFAFGFFFFLAVDTGLGEGDRDVVADFKPGHDRIDLSLYRDPPAFGSAEQPPPIFLGTGAFVESDALQIRYDVDGHRLVLQFFSPFTEVVERPPPVLPTGPTGEIEFIGLDNLTASDFIGEIDDGSSAAPGHWYL